MYFGSSPFPSGNCKSRQPFPFHSLLLMDFSGVALLLIGTAVVAIILGHEMACLASDADIDEIFASKRPYLTCVLYFICTLINCALKSVWYICKVPWLLRRQRSDKTQPATHAGAAITQATKGEAPWSSETNAECGDSAAFAKPR